MHSETRTLDPLIKSQRVSSPQPVRSTRRGTGLFQRVRRAKASIVESELAIRVKFETAWCRPRRIVLPSGMAREADVGERDRVAVALATGGSVFQVRFECSERGRVPMLAPFGAGRLKPHS